MRVSGKICWTSQESYNQPNTNEFLQELPPSIPQKRRLQLDQFPRSRPQTISLDLQHELRIQPTIPNQPPRLPLLVPPPPLPHPHQNPHHNLLTNLHPSKIPIPNPNNRPHPIPQTPTPTSEKNLLLRLKKFPNPTVSVYLILLLARCTKITAKNPKNSRGQKCKFS